MTISNFNFVRWIKKYHTIKCQEKCGTILNPPNARVESVIQVNKYSVRAVSFKDTRSSWYNQA